MKIYVTFGQVHTHSVNGKTFDKDSVAVIEAENYAIGRKKTFDYFGDQFYTTYHDLDYVKMDYFPRGMIDVEHVG